MDCMLAGRSDGVGGVMVPGLYVVERLPDIASGGSTLAVASCVWGGGGGLASGGLMAHGGGGVCNGDKFTLYRYFSLKKGGGGLTASVYGHTNMQ